MNAERAHELADECLRAIQSEIAENRATLKTNRQRFKALAARALNAHKTA